MRFNPLKDFTWYYSVRQNVVNMIFSSLLCNKMFTCTLNSHHTEFLVFYAAEILNVNKVFYSFLVFLVHAINDLLCILPIHIYTLIGWFWKYKE